VAIVCLAGVVAAAAPSRRDAELLKQKVTTINAFAAKPVKQGRQTTVTENEVNAYLAYDAGDQLPSGVVEPAVSILGAGRLSGRAVVDLDQVRLAHKPTGLFDPASLLTGRLPITAIGVLTTKNGVGRLALESATVGGVPIPKMVLQEIVSYYTRSRQAPNGIGLDDPFELPARIREIKVDRGQALVIQ
jgi:hypothetical protein